MLPFDKTAEMYIMFVFCVDTITFLKRDYNQKVLCVAFLICIGIFTALFYSLTYVE